MHVFDGKKWILSFFLFFWIPYFRALPIDTALLSTMWPKEKTRWFGAGTVSHQANAAYPPEDAPSETGRLCFHTERTFLVWRHPIDCMSTSKRYILWHRKDPKKNVLQWGVTRSNSQKCCPNVWKTAVLGTYLGICKRTYRIWGIASSANALEQSEILCVLYYRIVFRREDAASVRVCAVPHHVIGSYQSPGWVERAPSTTAKLFQT